MKGVSLKLTKLASKNQLSLGAPVLSANIGYSPIIIPTVPSSKTTSNSTTSTNSSTPTTTETSISKTKIIIPNLSNADTNVDT